MKSWLFCFLLTAGPAAAQRPTAEVAPAGRSFWPQEVTTGQVVFTAPLAQPGAAGPAQAAHVRTWLSSTCATWWEVQPSSDSLRLYKGLLRGVHEGVGLGFTVQIRRRPTGWDYRLFNCLVRSPTGTDVTHWLPLHRLLDDPDFRPDLVNFQQQLQQALPNL